MNDLKIAIVIVVSLLFTMAKHDVKEMESPETYINRIKSNAKCLTKTHSHEEQTLTSLSRKLRQRLIAKAKKQISELSRFGISEEYVFDEVNKFVFNFNILPICGGKFIDNSLEESLNSSRISKNYDEYLNKYLIFKYVIMNDYLAEYGEMKETLSYIKMWLITEDTLEDINFKKQDIDADLILELIDIMD